MLDGLVASHRVEQSPPYLFKNHAESAQFYCSYAVKNFEQILWYKQFKEMNLMSLGHQNIKYTYSEQAAEINLDEDTNSNATLTISYLTAKDNGVYFCAVQIHILAEENGVSQIPSVSWHLKGDSAEMKCSHNKGGSYYQMYWYRQRQGQSMNSCKWIFNCEGSGYRGQRCIFLCSFSQSNRVIQNPPDLFGTHQQSVKIQCEHSVPSYNQINWYRQDQGLTFIGYQMRTSSPQIENDFKTKVDIVGDGSKNLSLTIKNLLSNDSAVYFCAAYYTVLHICFIQYKNLCVNILSISLSPASVAWN
ncbi:uncharacterized protein LOC103458274 [Tachysurus ichikawai]